jgi:hypothetical protein
VPAETIGTIGGDLSGDTINVDVPTDTTSTTTNAGVLDWKNPIVIIALAALVIIAIVLFNKKG